jgi:hypothetical protein
MSRRTIRPIAALVIGLLGILPVAAQEQRQQPLPTTEATEPEPVNQWLDEVRAQRRTREQWRRAAKEAMDARRRWIDPWGAAEKEARDQEIQQRHEAFMEHIERDRKAFWNLAPWPAAPKYWQEDISTPATQVHSPVGTESPDVAGKEAPNVSVYPLPGWDNRWYYRGF